MIHKAYRLLSPTQPIQGGNYEFKIEVFNSEFCQMIYCCTGVSKVVNYGHEGVALPPGIVL